MSNHYDTIVIGAGPAGLTSGSILSEMGLKVLTLDEQNRIGGQIYRNIENASKENLDKMGPEYRRGLELAKRFRNSGAEYLPNAAVWNVEPEGRVCFSHQGVSERITANYVVIATGAMERPMPFPGWTLPGVIGAGAVNGLAKEANLTPSGAVVLAGSGPLLLLEAALLVEKKVDIAAILETTPKIPSLAVLSHLPKGLLGTEFLMKGMKMLLDIKKSKVPHFKGITNLRAYGDDAIAGITAECSGKELDFTAEMLLVHFGVIPDTHIYRLAGCKMEWNKEQRYWYPATDKWGRTNFEKIFGAGDGTGVSGALSAEYKGELAALEVACCHGIIPSYERDRLAATPLTLMKKDGYPRPLVDAVFAPDPKRFSFDDSTIICRCESITVAGVRKVVGEGVTDLNEVKTITRCGMGPCQGRMCGPALGEIVAAELDRSIPSTGLLSVRPPLKQIPLGEIAAMNIVVGGVDPANLFKNQSKQSGH